MGCHDGKRFRVGQRVHLTDSPDPFDARWPNALLGAHGTVTKTNPTTVWVQFDADGPMQGTKRRVAASAVTASHGHAECLCNAGFPVAACEAFNNRHED